MFAAVLLLAAATAVVPKPVDEHALHALLVERVDVRKWGTAIVVGVSSQNCDRPLTHGTPGSTYARKAHRHVAGLTRSPYAWRPGASEPKETCDRIPRGS